MLLLLAGCSIAWSDSAVHTNTLPGPRIPFLSPQVCLFVLAHHAPNTQNQTSFCIWLLLAVGYIPSSQS